MILFKGLLKKFPAQLYMPHLLHTDVQIISRKQHCNYIY